MVSLKLEATMISRDLESARSTIRGPTWRFHQPHQKVLPYRHALNWKNSPLSKTNTRRQPTDTRLPLIVFLHLAYQCTAFLVLNPSRSVMVGQETLPAACITIDI